MDWWSIILRTAGRFRAAAPAGNHGLASDALALQCMDRFADIVDRYIARQARGADTRRHNKTNFSALEFFVELQCVDDLFARKLWRQTRRQLESLEKIDNFIALIRRQSGSFN